VTVPALARAGVAHLYFESIHAFEDGNERIGRAIAEKCLAQTFGQPTLTALAATILARRKSYDDALEAANKQNEITAWLAWFAGVAIEAQRRTIALAEFLIDKAKLLDRLRGQLNDRQQNVLLRMFREGPEGFKGGPSASKYSTITGASPATGGSVLMALLFHSTSNLAMALYDGIDPVWMPRLKSIISVLVAVTIVLVAGMELMQKRAPRAGTAQALPPR